MNEERSATPPGLRVWKYPLALGSQPTVLGLPAGAKALSVGLQQGELRLWVQVDPAAPTEERRFLTVPTGYASVPDAARFVGTVLIDDSTFVIHVFEVTA